MTSRRTNVTTRKSPALTRGEERPVGLCSLDPYWFDQAAGEARASAREYAIRQAKAICADCPLTGLDGPCMKENREAGGVVAGLTKQERGALSRAKPCGTEAAYSRHRKAGENCVPCSRAATDAAAKRKAAKKAAKKAAA